MMKSKGMDRMRVLSLALAVIILVSFPVASWAVAITAVATGSSSPRPGSIGGTLWNGDFFIQDGAGTTNTGAGDGIDESTSWLFDFRTDSDFGSFATAAAPLATAFLTLELTSKDSLDVTDFFRLGGLTPFGGCGTCSPVDMSLFDLPTGATQIMQIQLLDYYTSNDLLTVFDNNFGMVSAQYGDDAIVSYASLHLARVPEPFTILLFGVGLIGIYLAKSGRRQYMSATSSPRASV